MDFVSQPIMVPEKFNGNNAFGGLPIGDWLKKIQEENSLEVVFYSKPESSECCQDPEYCIHATCIECPECHSFQTVRTTEPDENNISEFECLECECFFAAMNP